MEQEVTLIDMLNARDRRAFTQQNLLNTYQVPMISFTMNIAGPVKNNDLIRSGFELGKRWLKERLRAQNITWIHEEEIHEITGNEAYFLISQDPMTIKQITSELEDDSELGRLFDLDVLDKHGKKLDRTELGFSPRTCLICGSPAKACARSRTHTVAELQARTWEILKKAIEDSDAKEAAALACRALLYEVCTTPKPGLVDRANSGSHKDMDIFTFMNSSSVLWPYFETCVHIGRQTAHLTAPETFQRLRQAGKKAEADMFSATNGVNTHKGAVFSIGILCAALGRLPRNVWNSSDTVLDECAAMTKGLVASDFSGLTKENAKTTGQKLYLQYGITGIRGQIEAGLPAVRTAGLPILKQGIAQGLHLNDAGCAALLSLMTAADDTNLIARSNVSTQQKTVKALKDLLARTPFPDRQTLKQIDNAFIEQNLSPGGSADLLAICYLLYFLESENTDV